MRGLVDGEASRPFDVAHFKGDLLFSSGLLLVDEPSHLLLTIGIRVLS